MLNKSYLVIFLVLLLVIPIFTEMNNGNQPQQGSTKRSINDIINSHYQEYMKQHPEAKEASPEKVQELQDKLNHAKCGHDDLAK
ncbi:hypothetical protein DLAC_00883 [Tieghemostelium lacteum]|uniref:Uncharacterized protein n=1 Tax=Tieghemostelium lacteum TaxID=361077 RepID=A0A152A768_TIELA|nr:hypothetical protein DLAC_00883 [Tieghemostelium lacteum]|eukprot:KYR02082.1 hypothetical protein DLAC_00883 [Tieghemostelium lacteum]